MDGELRALWKTKSIESQLEDLRISAHRLEGQRAALLSQSFEQEAIEGENAWRRRHAGEMLGELVEPRRPSRAGQEKES